MAKSFCTGCKHWRKTSDFSGRIIHFCGHPFLMDDYIWKLEDRKSFCYGKYNKK